MPSRALSPSPFSRAMDKTPTKADFAPGKQAPTSDIPMEESVRDHFTMSPVPGTGQTTKDSMWAPAEVPMVQDAALAPQPSKSSIWATVVEPAIEPACPDPVDTMSQPNLMSQAVLTPPSLSYKPVTSASRDHWNISHDPTCDSSRDPSAFYTTCDLSARDPGNLRPCDPGKITHDLSRNWLSTKAYDKTHFGCTSNPLINTWQIVGTINKTHPLNNQRTCDAT